MLAAVASGDSRALASLYDRYSTLVYSVALRVCQDSGLAEEVLQNLFMQIWLVPRQIATGPGSLGGQFGLLARNLAVDRMRKQQSTGPSPGPSFDPIRHTEVRELMQRPHALVLLLPDADRRLLEMAFFDDKKPVEIADESGLAPAIIRSRISGALTAIRNDAEEGSRLGEDTGLEVSDLETDEEFNFRKPRAHDISGHIEGLRRLTLSFLESPDTILQELVNAAVDLCGADSAGISLELEQKTDTAFWRWVATAGQYNGFLNATLPRYPSACGVCLKRAKPQLFRVRQRFFDIMGISAPLVTDGILLPWRVGESRGTIFIMAHGRSTAFDKYDGQLMHVLADFAAMAVRNRHQQQALVEQAKSAAAADMANKLAHRINNPLQSLLNQAYLAAGGHCDTDPKALGRELCTDLERLSLLVSESLVQQRKTPD